MFSNEPVCPFVVCLFVCLSAVCLSSGLLKKIFERILMIFFGVVGVTQRTSD